ncbi:MAG: glycosyltransferase [Planctomycetota bacterium]
MGKIARRGSPPRDGLRYLCVAFVAAISLGLGVYLLAAYASVFSLSWFPGVEGWRHGERFRRLFGYSTLFVGGFSFLVVLRYLAIFAFSFLHFDQEQRAGDEGPWRAEEGEPPLVAVLIPAYREERDLAATIDSICAQDYPRFVVLVVDDGSNDPQDGRPPAYDATLELARAKEREHPGRVLAFSKPNGRKASALNRGVREALSLTPRPADLILCVDADAELAPGTLLRMVRRFVEDPGLDALAGKVTIRNADTPVTRLQALEYSLGHALPRRAQGYFSSVLIVPGPCGMFRMASLERLGLIPPERLCAARQARLPAGPYDPSMSAEDCDLTLRLLSRGARIAYEPGASSSTDALEIGELIAQRRRWNRGVVEAVIARGGWGPLVGLTSLLLMAAAVHWLGIAVWGQAYGPWGARVGLAAGLAVALLGAGWGAVAGERVRSRRLRPLFLVWLGLGLVGLSLLLLQGRCAQAMAGLGVAAAAAVILSGLRAAPPPEEGGAGGGWLVLASLYLFFESVLWPFANTLGVGFFVLAGLLHTVEPAQLLLWFGTLLLVDLLAGVFSLLVEGEDPFLAPYAVATRVTFQVMLDTCKLVDVFDELCSARMEGWLGRDRGLEVES